MSIWGIHILNGHLNEVGEVRLPSLVGLYQMVQGELIFKSSSRALLDPNLEGAVVRRNLQQLAKGTQLAQAGWDLYEPLPQTAEEAKVWTGFIQKWKDLDTANRQLSSLLQQARDSRNPEAYATARIYAVTTQYDALEAVDQDLERLIAIQRAVATQEQSLAHRDSTRISTSALVLAILGTALGIGLGVVLGRAISRPIIELTRSLNQGATEISKAAAEVASASQTLAAGACQQSASLEETSASLEELTATTRSNHQSTVGAQALATEMRVAAETGVEHTRTMEAATESINVASQEMTEAIGRIQSSGRDVVSIVKTIDEIAFQPISWRSMPRWKRLARVKRVRDLPS